MARLLRAQRSREIHVRGFTILRLVWVAVDNYVLHSPVKTLQSTCVVALYPKTTPVLDSPGALT